MLIEKVFITVNFSSPTGDANFLWTFVRIVLPGLWLIANPSVETLYGFLFSLNVIGCLFLSVLLYFYARQVLTNTTTRERNDDSARVYDHGTKHNVEVGDIYLHGTKHNAEVGGIYLHGTKHNVEVGGICKFTTDAHH